MTQPKRQKCQPKIYTESDLRRKMKEAQYRIAVQNMKVWFGAFGLVLFRNFGFDREKIAQALDAIEAKAMDTLCFTDVRRELLDETGLDIAEYVEDKTA